MSYWIDTHTHFGMLEDTPEIALDFAKSQGVEKFINIGTNPDDHMLVLNFAKKNYPAVFCTLGVHPHDAKVYTDAVDADLRKHANEKEVIAIGEIGLDYYYMNSNKEEQWNAFEKQLQVAIDLDLPVEIHTRDAEQDTINILKKLNGKVKGLLHCFTGTQWLADEALKIGFNISISGIVTFKNAKDLQDTVKTIPLDRLHVETDAPFLTPMPHRGKKNQPAYVKHVGEFVAQLKNISPEELQKQTLANTKKLFRKFVS
jgi:TatD DNase family protein